MTPYYDDGRVTIYHGDALDGMAALTAVGAILLDPPYSMVPNAFGGRDDGAAGTSGAPVRLLTETLQHARRLLPEGGVAGLVCDWRRLPDVAYIATRESLRINTCIAWTRSTAGMGSLFRSAWDPVLVLSRGTPLVKDKAAIRNVIHTAGGRSVTDHPYEKPTALWRHLLDRIPSTTVLDPFAGSGAGLLAAIEGGHRAIGIEIEERYCEIAAKRCSQEVLDLGGAV